jgi:integrating conjugative element protein (TIGR03756 family)
MNNLRPRLKSLLWVFVGCAFAVSSYAAAPIKQPQPDIAEDSFSLGFHSVSSTKLAARSLACTNCLDWSLIGTCTWLECKFLKCKVVTTPKVKHFIPDAVVATYSSKFPISDIRRVMPTFNVTPGTISHPNDDADTGARYKHASVFGNPALVGYKALNTAGGWMCESVVKRPWVMYFHSEIDPQWKMPLIEMLNPQALVGLPKINGALPLSSWGQVYPRTGWQVHSYDAINGAVAAHRAADIVTGGISLHVATQLGSDCGQKCWPPGRVKANDADTHKFQSLFPIYEKSARPFGGDPAAWANASIRPGSVRPGRDKYNEQAYAYALWRPYRCCQKRGSFLFDTSF